MKRKLIALVSAVLLLAMAVLPASALVHYAYVKTGNYGALNMRSSTVTHMNNKIGSIPYGKKVVILDYYENNNWAFVEYQGKQGFVMTRYLTYSVPPKKPTHVDPTPAPEPSSAHIYDGFQATNYFAIVRPSTPAGFVHMRWAPSKSIGCIVRDYYNGTQLEVIAQNKTWAQVRDPQTGVTGFMMRSFLTEVGDGVNADAAEE